MQNNGRWTSVHCITVKAPVMNCYMRASAPSKEMEEWHLYLSTRLESLTSGVNYALLTLASNCIDVFRDSSGRYGLFDPHSRTPEGFASPIDTSIMLTFKHLAEMMNEIHTMFSDVSDVSSYDFMPLSFQSVIRYANDNQDIQYCAKVLGSIKRKRKLKKNALRNNVCFFFTKGFSKFHFYTAAQIKKLHYIYFFDKCCIQI